ncbi:MAG: Uma2 family endonuclease [Ferruginibacter sp.]|nr:Uma2 family endonuclease [Ferruginibacter sp.]
MKFQIENFNADVKGFLHDEMSDEEFFDFCQQNPDLKLERDHNKQIYIMAPTGYYTGGLNSDIFGELYIWNKKFKTGKVFDSSTGFTLPDGTVFSPDAAWVSNEKNSLLSEEDKNKFAPVCPNFVIELKSPSDRLKILKGKMLKWIENGTQLAWLIDPENQMVFIYREDGSVAIIRGFTNKLSGENVLPGFEFDLQILQ